MRARQPDHSGFAERDGIRLYWEVFGTEDPTIALLPTWSILPSRFWKLQVATLARRHRIVTFDGRGSGQSSRPTGADAYTPQEFAADIEAVLDATGTERAVLVALSAGATWAIQFAADHPQRTQGIVAIGPAVDLAPQLGERAVYDFDEPLDTSEGWAKYNSHHWRRDYRDFLEFFFAQMFHEWHSTKQIEDCVGWGLETTAEVLIDTARARHGSAADVRGLCARVTAPVLVIHGDKDHIRPYASGAALAELTNGELVTIAGGGHGTQSRDPIVVNHLIEEFVDRVQATPRRRTWVHAARRPKRALYVSSPIGLGHALRDASIADELRKLHPDLQIDWLAQHPVTKVLADRGEHVHPGSRWLASESAHIEDEAGEHDLHAFQAIRRMDEILVSNFTVFNDIVRDEHYDLVIGDEAWDIDYFLHENPELKHFAFAWMTDFVGWLPMPEGGDQEAALCADYNAEMIEQRARYKRLRDRSIFIGEPDDIVPDSFGFELPGIREWTAANFEFPGYVTGFDPAEFTDREALRAQLGYHDDERVCVVAVGGSGVGGDLVRRVVDAALPARRVVDGLRFVVVVGPRLDPRDFPRRKGVSYRKYVPQLYRHLAACDLAIVHGGLTTCMELTANRRPFIYVPLRHHFEQNFHVHHRLQRYGAGRRLDYHDAADADQLAKVIADEIGRSVDYLPVDPGGAARAAASIGALL
ncbi:MAG TPA: alpha/beta fold hydrolase [Ilumatobacteraceae bacterium]|nr:alpha/beta fold hydrolase [Ilumatobacteraceae bacterium]